MNCDIELEKLVQEVYKEVDEVNDIIKLTPNLKIGELKCVLERVMGFVDFCKFEFGEDITER